MNDNPIAAFLLQILRVVSDTISVLLGMLPNPDPFPAILDGIQLQSNDALVVAYYWLDQFFMADVVIRVLGLWFLMFPLAWVIMMLWKWIKAR